MGDGAGIEELVLGVVNEYGRRGTRHSARRTGIFFWVMTTAVSLPLTAIAVCPEPEMALKAYSVQRRPFSRDFVLIA